MELYDIGEKAKAASSQLVKLGTEKKNEVLGCVARALCDSYESILEANEEDIQNAKQRGMSEGLLDRLKLTKERIEQMAEGVLQVKSLDDPIGETISEKVRPNGLRIASRRVPLGVVGIIYEARPNVTADAFALCFKTGNAVILKGGSDALHSNQAIVKTIQAALKRCEVSEDSVLLIEQTDRETTTAFMKMNGYLDVLIPRGGAGLIQSVVKNATVPVIETGTGNCHIYVDESANIDMAVDIIFNAKTQRIGVCNACESLVVHEKIEKDLMPVLCAKLAEKKVQIRGDQKAMDCGIDVIPAKEEDWGREYLDYILSVKTVSDISEAISHINRYNTGHSEAIITQNYENAERFLNEIDAACVYVNASTRFTDGFEFGYGAEIGISTQKLHARGPMGLLALTSSKYVIHGNGQIR